MKCCSNCFGDRQLQKAIIHRSTEIGRCSYCGSQEIELVLPALLKEHFAPVISVYEPSEDGMLLVPLMQADWGMFDNGRLEVQGARSLLGDVLGDGDIMRQNFVFSSRYQQDGLHLRWDKLRDELINTNRYFPDSDLDKERLAGLLTLLHAEDIPSTWYRARLQPSAEIFSITEMGAPPKSVASHGRANPPGIPYLYLGSTEETAVAEVRPHTGEMATVADFHVDGDLRLIDLRNPKRLISPFVFGDEDQIAALRNDIPFIERLGHELIQPVVPHRAAIDYVPSQYLCEFIKKTGYDGVIYSSSVSSGINLALFNPAKATSGSVQQRRVTRVSVSIQ